MKVETIYCDVCGATPALTSYFYIDRRLDAAGSWEDIRESLDLCGKCSWRAYKIAETSGGFTVARIAFNELSGLANKRYAKSKNTRELEGME